MPVHLTFNSAIAICIVELKGNAGRTTLTQNHTNKNQSRLLEFNCSAATRRPFRFIPHKFWDFVGSTAQALNIGPGVGIRAAVGGASFRQHRPLKIKVSRAV